MEASERDSTSDWLLPADAAPPRIEELEARIDEAVETARASEAAVRIASAAAVDAAGEARRAAELAERASEAALAAGQVAADQAAAVPASPWEDERLRAFTERADRVVARLRSVEDRLTPMQG